MLDTVYQIVRTIRPRQWLKNFALFAVPVLNGIIFDPDVLFLSIKAFIAFCILASGTYFFNDLTDAPKDRLHPIKKNRPIASGKLSTRFAWQLMVFFYALGLWFAFSQIGTFFGIAGLAYMLLQFSYSLYFRNVIILDALIVSSGFVLRVYAGGMAVDTSVSSWLILTTIGLALLMAFGKRRSEKTLIGELEDPKTRDTLRHYPDSLLDSIISMSSSFCVMSYSIFTFQTSPIVKTDLFSDILPSILKTPKWMMLTIPMVIYGVARYLFIIYEKKEGESPERVLLSDKPLLFTVILWGISVLAIVYFLPA